jgi:hypothetical protein
MLYKPEPIVTDSVAKNVLVKPVTCGVSVSTREVVEVVVSKIVSLGNTVVAPVGNAPFCTNETVTVSVLAASKSAETENVDAVVESEAAPTTPAVPAVAALTVNADTVADDGTTERTPKPNAATATSAIRLNVVFVDICFLSIVDPRTIRRSA